MKLNFWYFSSLVWQYNARVGILLEWVGGKNFAQDSEVRWEVTVSACVLIYHKHYPFHHIYIVFFVRMFTAYVARHNQPVKYQSAALLTLKPLNTELNPIYQ